MTTAPASARRLIQTVHRAEGPIDDDELDAALGLHIDYTLEQQAIGDLLVPGVLPEVVARLEDLARSRPFLLASVWTSNLLFAEQPWLAAVSPDDAPDERLGIRLFKTT